MGVRWKSQCEILKALTMFMPNLASALQVIWSEEIMTVENRRNLNSQQ